MLRDIVGLNTVDILDWTYCLILNQYILNQILINGFNSFSQCLPNSMFILFLFHFSV